MSRSSRLYADGAEGKTFEGFDASTPIAGYYRMKLRSGGVRGVVKLVYGPPLDPVTGEELDRSWRWQAFFNGEMIDVERAWPGCAADPTTEEHYQRAIARQSWAQESAPDSAYADPRKKLDLLSSPLPF